MISRRAVWLGLALGGALACGELFAPPLKTAVLSIVPDFGAAGVQQADVDRLRVRIYLDSAGAFQAQPKVDETIAIQGDSAVGTFTLPILVSPTRALVRLDAIRSSDGLVMFSGVDTLFVRDEQSGQQSAPVPITVRYVGPVPTSISITPKDTVVEAGASFTFHATAESSDGTSLPVRFELVNAADASVLTVGRITGDAQAAAGAEGDVLVRAITPDTSLADTARVLVGRIPDAIVVSPGFANVAVGDSVALTATVYDVDGNTLPAPLTWTSRNPGVATVSAAGKVIGVAVGTARIVVQENVLQHTDSVLVTVPAAGNVVVTTYSAGRAFRVPMHGDTLAVGDTVRVDVVADMRYTPNELLGSYNATLAWDAAVLRYVDVQAGDLAAPTVNAANAGSGQLRFSAADASGASGAVVVATIRFVVQAAGTTTPSIIISEMSAAVTFTNLISRVTVTNGHIRIP